MKTSPLHLIGAGLLGNKPSGEEAACTYISQPRWTCHFHKQLYPEVSSWIPVKGTPSSRSPTTYSGKISSELVKSQKTTSLQNRIITSASYSGVYNFITNAWQVPILTRPCRFKLAFFLTSKYGSRSIYWNTQEQIISTKILHGGMQQIQSSLLSLKWNDGPQFPMSGSLHKDFSIPSFLWILPWHPTLIFCMQKMSFANSYSVLPSNIV